MKQRSFWLSPYAVETFFLLGFSVEDWEIYGGGFSSDWLKYDNQNN